MENKERKKKEKRRINQAKTQASRYYVWLLPACGRIQLLTSIVRCRPQCLCLAETVTTLLCVHKLLVNCKLPDVASWLLRCLLALTHIYVDHSISRQHADATHTDNTDLLTKDQWTHIFNDCLRYLQQLGVVNILDPDISPEACFALFFSENL